MTSTQTIKIKMWHCRNCGHEEPVTGNDIQELTPLVSSTGAIKISCPNCGAYTVSKPFDDTCTGGVFEVVRPHVKRYGKKV